MKHLSAIILPVAIFFCSCGHSGQSRTTLTKDSTAAADSGKNEFFPIAEYLESEIMHVDSTPYEIKKFTTINGRADSALISIPEFNLLAVQFLPKELGSDNFEKDFTENSIYDKSTQTITFSYTPTVSSPVLQRIDVTTFPSNGNQLVKSIYMEQTRTSGDSTILDRMYWRAMRNFQIISLIHIKGKPTVEQKLRVVWDSDQGGE